MSGDAVTLDEAIALGICHMQLWPDHLTWARRENGRAVVSCDGADCDWKLEIVVEGSTT